MDSQFPRRWMWADAIEMHVRATRLNREMFAPRWSASRRLAWEPPVDVFETESAVLILVALPGVDPRHVELSIENGHLNVSGERTFADEVGTAVVHRLEVPQGRFERSVPLPPGRYSDVRRSASNGCLSITLQKSGVSGG